MPIMPGYYIYRKKIPPGRFISTPRQYYKAESSATPSVKFADEVVLPPSNRSIFPSVDHTDSGKILMEELLETRETLEMLPPPSPKSARPPPRPTKRDDDKEKRHLFQI